jgi:hypothetical protein
VADLSSARSKLRWAERRLDELKNDVRVFLDTKPYTIVHERDEESRDHRWRVRVERQPPAEDWAMIFGDCIHNARAALDHILWQIAGSSPTDTTTQFPIFIDPAKFRSSGTRPLKLLDRRAVAFVKWLQPYRRSDPFASKLWPIQLFDAADKHKTVLAGLGVLEASTLDMHLPARSRVLQDAWIEYGPLKTEAIVAEAKFRVFPLDGSPPHTNVEVDAEFSFGVAIHDTVSGATCIGDVEIARYLACVEGIIDDAERLL